MIPVVIEWQENNRTLKLLDQTKLPVRLVHLTCRTHQDVCVAIKRLSVRGAPAIGIAAAYGVVLAACQASKMTPQDRDEFIESAISDLAQTRPTAVNLFWALNLMKQELKSASSASGDALIARLLTRARYIHEDDRARCEQIGQHGVALLADGFRILTHCNAGALATGGIGTALAPIYLAHKNGMQLHVFADETRPLLQGARLTVWELMQAGVDVTLISDNTAAYTIRTKQIDCIITGADRITRNGDVANKIGTYGLAVFAKHHDIPFYVAAPVSTFDFALETGDDIPIEIHATEILTESFGERIAPLNADAFVPAFDVTPHDLVTAIVTEKGIIRPPYADAIAALAE